ncbi:MAG: SURF1 family protein [Actinomycetota bacterium]
MYRFLLKPKWLGFHLLCAAAIAGMVTAGFWQLDRHHQRQAFEAEVRNRQQAPAVPFEELDLSEPSAVEWRNVTATGTYDTDHQFTVVNISQDGTGGTDPVNGLVLQDGTVLIVNRGFLPGAQPTPPPPSGEVTVSGRVRLSQTAKLGQGSDDGSQELTQIRRVDLGALSQQFDQQVQPVYVDQLDLSAEPDGMRPVAPPDLGGGPPHLSYTVQWFIFSVAVAAGWVLAVRKSARAVKQA